MTDSHPPGGWPWGKGKPGSQNPGSEVGQGSQAQLQQDKGVQEPELQQSEAGGQAQSQVNKSTKAPSAFRSPESVTNKSVKYEDEQPVSVQAPGSNKSAQSNKSFSRTGQDPDPEEDVGEEVDDATEKAESKAESKAGGVPDDEGKDLTEPAEEGQQQSQKAASQSGTGLTGFASGVKGLFGGSSKQSGADSTAEDSVKQLQEQLSQGGGQTLTAPGEGQTSTEENTQENTPGETEDTEEGLTNISGEELRPDDSITHAADQPPTEDQDGATTQAGKTYTEGYTEGQTTPGAGQTTPGAGQTTVGAPTQFTEGQTQETEGETGDGQTQFTEGQPGEEQTQYAEGQTEAGQTEGQQLPQDVQDGQTNVGAQTNAGAETTAYETGTTETADIDYSILKGCKVNKAGNVVNDKGQAIGRITQGTMKNLIGRKVDENGIIWNDSGKEVGRAEPIPDNELQDLMEGKPFESFEGNVIDAKGWVKWQDQTVGQVVDGDLKALQGKTVDADGDILDTNGNVIGKAERYEEEEQAAEEAVDMSALAGKRINKAGNAVDGSGVIYGRLIEGDLKNCVGRMCNKNGEVLSEAGDVIGHVELVTEGEREGSKEGPFAELEGLSVAKDGTVVTAGGDIVGRLVSGDPKVLAGRRVDADGDVVDGNGNVLGHAERWEPEPEPEKEKGALAGLHVNNEGNVVDKNGNTVAKLTSGDPYICGGKEIDDDGDVVDSKGNTIGHVTLLSEIKEEEPEEEVGETAEEKEERENREHDQELAKRMSVSLEQCLDKVKPILKMITSKIEAAEAKPEDERDEEQLVKEVKPLIEEGGNILREAHGVIRGLDPDGHIQANAKARQGTRECTPEEYHLADVIKELTGHVEETIENAKRKLEGMPKAKKELNPLWGLLNEPLFQIIAAVGLLLSGVLGIVGRLLGGLGLGGIVDGLLGSLGLDKILSGLGLGSITGKK